METYYAINVQDRQRYRKLLLLLLGGLLVAGAMTNGQYLLILPGVFILFLAFYRRTMEINERGLVTCYDYVFYKNRSETPFTAFSDLVVDASQPDTMMVFIRRGVSTFAMFRREDTSRILELAEQGNGRLRIATGGIKANKRSL